MIIGVLRVHRGGVYLFHITSNREHKIGPSYRLLLASDNRNIISSNAECQLRVDVLWLNSITKTQLVPPLCPAFSRTNWFHAQAPSKIAVELHVDK